MILRSKTQKLISIKSIEENFPNQKKGIAKKSIKNTLGQKRNSP